MQGVALGLWPDEVGLALEMGELDPIAELARLLAIDEGAPIAEDVPMVDEVRTPNVEATLEGSVVPADEACELDVFKPVGVDELVGVGGEPVECITTGEETAEEWAVPVAVGLRVLEVFKIVGACVVLAVVAAVV